MTDDGTKRTGVLVRRDFAAGLLVAIVGSAIAIAALDLRIGTPARMGPGFLPLGLGVLLTLIGIATAAGAVRQGDPLPRFVRPRALAVLVGAFVAFAVLIEPVGLILAAMAAVLISSFATSGRHVLEAVAYAAGLAAFAYLVFIEVLDMPLRVWP